MRLLREIKRLADKVTGKDKVKNQYDKSVKASHNEEAQSLQKLAAQQRDELAKIAAQRQSLELLKQQGTACFLEDKALFAQYQVEHEKLQAEKKAAFQKTRQKIIDNMELIRAALTACMNGNVEIVEMLLKRDLVLRFNFFNLYPLHIAAENNQTAIIKLLCQYGVNLNRVNNEADSALDLAESCGNIKAIQLLKRLVKESEAMLPFAERGDIAAIQTALKGGADINITNSEGYNILQIAIIHHQDFKIIEELINCGADLNHAGNNKKSALELAANHPNPRLKLLIADAMGVLAENPLITSTVLYGHPSSEGFFKGWSDSNGWALHQYFATIKMEIMKAGGIADKFYICSRSASCILLYSYDPQNNIWVGHPIGPAYSNSGGWGARPYYSTIQTKVLRQADGSEILYLIARSSHGIYLSSFDPKKNHWTEHPMGPAYADNGGWGAEPYYSTIQAQVLRRSDGSEILYLIARSSHGVYLSSFDSKKNHWTEHPMGPAYSDKGGWGAEKYYSTIQAQVLRHSDGSEILYLIARSEHGIYLSSFDPNKNHWSEHPMGPAYADKGGWAAERYFSTIQTQALKIKEGAEHLYLIARDQQGICLVSFNPERNEWTNHANNQAWSDIEWSEKQYYSTIRISSIGQSKLLLMGRGKAGVKIHCYDAESKLWAAIFNGRELSDAEGWAAETYYSSITFHQTIINNQVTLLLSARSASGLLCFAYAINLKLLDTLFKPQLQINAEQLMIENQKVQSFLNRVSALSAQLLEASRQGNWVEVKEHLLQGAYINAVDAEGYNALQKAIIAKAVSLELLHGLIEAGIDLNHKSTNQQDTLALFKQHLPQMAHILSDEPVMGIQKSLSSPATPENFKASFKEHCDRAQSFLDKYPDEKQKIKAMLSYYYWLSKVEPYAIYVFPLMLMLSQLEEILKKAEASLPDGLINSLPTQPVLEAAQEFFKKTRAMHCVLNEIGNQALNAEPEWVDFNFVSNSIQLKREAVKIAKQLGSSIQYEKVFETLYNTEKSLFLTGMVGVLRAFVTQVFGKQAAELIEIETTAKEMLEYQQQHRAQLKEIIKQQMGEHTTEMIRAAATTGLIQLPAKLSLKKGLAVWEIGHQAVQLKIQQGEAELQVALQQEKAALQAWLNQREAEYLGYINQLNTHIQISYQVDNQINAEFQKATHTLRQSFADYRQELGHDYHKAKRKINKNLAKQFVALGAAAFLAPFIAPTLTASLGATLGVTASTTTMATLNLMVEGALIGGMSAGFSGNTGGILKGAFISGWIAGFGATIGSVLDKSATMTKLNSLFSTSVPVMKVGEKTISHGVVTSAVVAGMKTAVQIGLEDGKLSDGLLISIGSTLALGGWPSGSNEIGFLAKLNEKFASVLVSATITSVVTRSSFLENAAMIGTSTLIQSTASHLGNRMAENAVKIQSQRAESSTKIEKALKENEAALATRSNSSVDNASSESKPILVANTKANTSPLKENAKTTHLSFPNISEDLEQFYKPSLSTRSSNENARVTQNKSENIASKNPHIPSRVALNALKQGESNQKNASVTESAGSIDLGQRFGRAANALLELMVPTAEALTVSQYYPDKTSFAENKIAIIPANNDRSSPARADLKEKNQRQLNVFERRDNLDTEIRQGAQTWSEYPTREFTEWPATGPRESAIAIGTTTQMGIDTIKGVIGLGEFTVDAFLSTESVGVFFPEVQNKALERHTDRLRATAHAVVHYKDTTQQISEGLKNSFEQAVWNYKHGNYFDSGRNLGDIGSVVLPVGALGLGATKLIYNASNVTAKTVTQSLKFTARETSLVSRPLQTSWDRFRYNHNSTDLSLNSYSKGIRAEQAAIPAIEKMGFQFKPCKLPSNQGFDHVAIRYGANGIVSDILIIESKFSKTGVARLSETVGKGTQMGPVWIEVTLKEMMAKGGADVQRTAELILDNRDRIILKGNILNPEGLNKWKPLTEEINQLHLTP